MFLSDLPSTEPASGQYIAVDDGEQTYKIDYDALADAIINKMLANKVANNLSTSVAGFVLDARQGRALGNRLTTAEGDIDNVEETLGNFSTTGKSTAANTTLTVQLPNNYRGILITNGVGTALKGMYILSTPSSPGTVTILDVKAASSVTVSSAGSSVVSIANSTSNQLSAVFLNCTPPRPS